MSLRDEIQAEQRIAELEKTAQTLQRQLAAAKSKDADLVAAVEQGAGEGLTHGAGSEDGDGGGVLVRGHATTLAPASPIDKYALRSAVVTRR